MIVKAAGHAIDIVNYALWHTHVLAIGQLRKPGVRLVALHVDQPSLGHSHVRVRMIELIKFPNFVEQHAVRVRLLDLPPGLLRARQFVDRFLVPVHLQGSGIERRVVGRPSIRISPRSREERVFRIDVVRVAARRQHGLLLAVGDSALVSFNSTRSYDSRLSAETGADLFRYLSWKPRASKGVGVPGLVSFLSEDTGTDDGDAFTGAISSSLSSAMTRRFFGFGLSSSSLSSKTSSFLLLLLGDGSVVVDHEVIVRVSSAGRFVFPVNVFACALYQRVVRPSVRTTAPALFRLPLHVPRDVRAFEWNSNFLLRPCERSTPRLPISAGVVVLQIATGARRAAIVRRDAPRIPGLVGGPPHLHPRGVRCDPAHSLWRRGPAKVCFAGSSGRRFGGGHV